MGNELSMMPLIDQVGYHDMDLLDDDDFTSDFYYPSSHRERHCCHCCREGPVTDFIIGDGGYTDMMYGHRPVPGSVVMRKEVVYIDKNGRKKKTVTNLINGKEYTKIYEDRTPGTLKSNQPNVRVPQQIRGNRIKPPSTKLTPEQIRINKAKEKGGVWI